MSGAFRADFVGLIGATGSGKSLRVRELLRRHQPARLVICDPMDEYGEFAPRVDSCAALVEVTRAPSFKARFIWSRVPKVRKLQFNAICETVLKRGRCWFVVDELGDVDSPTPFLIPPSWDELCRQGRHARLAVLGCAQDPTMVNKRFFNACRVIRCGCLSELAHVTRMASYLHVPAADVLALKPRQWIERDRDTHAVTRGEIALPKAIRARGQSAGEPFDLAAQKKSRRPPL